MADSKITKKLHPMGSLAARILSVSILLLVVPLFFQALFLYWQEYREKVQDFQAQLEVLAKERAHLIEEMIQMDWRLLDSNVKPLYITKIPLPQGVADRFVLVNRSRDAILVGRKESGTTASVIAIPFTEVISGLEKSSVRLALLDAKGKVLEENKKFPKGVQLLEVKKPIYQTDLTLQLSMDQAQIHGLHLQTYLFRFGVLVFFVGVIGGGAVYLFARRIAKPLRNLCKTMDRVSEGASHVRYTPDSMGFEINALGIQFNQTLDSLLRHSQEAERERLTRERLAEELRIGHEIQSNLLPSHVPGFPGVDLATGYFASREVNGDFYDLFRLENGKLLLVICDTAGKGISACLFSLGLRSIIRSLASSTTDLSEIVRRANDLYYLDAHESAMFSTLWLGIYDPARQHLVFCSQGHPPAILRHERQLQELWTGGIALGAQKIDIIPTKEATLAPGDLLILYTDGIIEAHDPDDQLFGKKRLHELILRKKHESAQQIADQIIDEVQAFGQGVPQHDDMTLVVLRISD